MRLPREAKQREHNLREVFNGVRYGVALRAMPNDLPPWHAVYDQAQRWLRAGRFAALVHDLRAMLLRLAEGLAKEPSAAVFNSHTLRSTPESGSRAARDGAEAHPGLDTAYGG